MMKRKCKCGKLALWVYMPANEMDEEDSYCCDDCVPRGCSCNEEAIDGNYDNPALDNWVEKTDEQGRKLPCCEWWYDENGWDV